MADTELADKHCAPCNGQIPLLSEAEIVRLLAQLDDEWQLGVGSTSLQRDFTFKGFAKATYLANLCAWLADREGHHPDIRFGWGYCTVVLTTHDVGGLSENDFIWAARLDHLTG